MEGLERLTFALDQPSPGFRVAPLTYEVARILRQIPRDLVPDLPDRVIAATALAIDLPPGYARRTNPNV